MTDDPVATAVQHEHELAALDLTEHPTVKAAYRTVAENWLARTKPSDAMRARFDEAVAEVMFSAAVWSSNQDTLEVPHLRWVSSEERATELAHRRAGYLRRLPEGTL